jgi:hypothetical protein
MTSTVTAWGRARQIQLAIFVGLVAIPVILVSWSHWKNEYVVKC